MVEHIGPVGDAEGDGGYVIQQRETAFYCFSFVCFVPHW